MELDDFLILFDNTMERATQFLKRSCRSETRRFSSGLEQYSIPANTIWHFQSAITTLQTLVIALGAGLGVWGGINLLEGYGNENPGANAHVR